MKMKLVTYCRNRIIVLIRFLCYLLKYNFGVVLIFWFVDNTSTFKKGLVTLGKYKLVQGSEVSGFDRTTGIQIFVPISIVYYMLPNYA